MMLNLIRLIEQNTPEVSNRKLIDDFSHYVHQHFDLLSAKRHTQWILRFTQFHNQQHPFDLNQSDISTFLTALFIEQQFDAKTQQDAFNSLTILYRDFLKHPIENVSYLKAKKRLGVADRLSPELCHAVVDNMQGTSRLMTQLVIGAKLKLNEVVNIRITDIDIKAGRLLIRDSKDVIKETLKIPLYLNLDLRIQVMRIKQLIRVKTSQLLKQKTEQNSPPLKSEVQRLKKSANEFLFPISTIDNPQQSSKAMQLALLKNDIRIAYQQYLRMTPLRKDSRKHLSWSKISPIRSVQPSYSPVKQEKFVHLDNRQQNLDFIERGVA